MPLDFDWPSDLDTRVAEITGETFASLIDAAERSLRYADQAGSTIVHDYIGEAGEAAERAFCCAPNGCCRFLADDIARRCDSMLDQIGFPRGIEAAYRQVELLQAADQTRRLLQREAA